MSKSLIPKNRTGPKQKLNNRKFKQILEDIKLFGSTEGACAKNGIPRDTFYTALRQHPQAKEAYQMARDEANWRIEQEIARRGIQGVRQPVFYKGDIVGHIEQYSDKMLELLAKANLPERYSAKNTIDVNVKHSAENPKEKLLSLLEGDIIEAEYDEVSDENS